MHVLGPDIPEMTIHLWLVAMGVIVATAKGQTMNEMGGDPEVLGPTSVLAADRLDPSLKPRVRCRHRLKECEM